MVLFLGLAGSGKQNVVISQLEDLGGEVDSYFAGDKAWDETAGCLPFCTAGTKVLPDFVDNNSTG